MSVRQDNSPLPSRRRAGLALGSAVGSALLLDACGSGGPAPVGPTESLLLQHGLMRRVLSLYRRYALALRINPAVVDSGGLAQAADLFRSYGEDFHERALEEAYVFPRLQRAGGALAALLPVLQEQHERGRQLNDFIYGHCASGPVVAEMAEPVARAMEFLADMYQAHAAYEDTVVYPAWRKLLGPTELNDLSQRFAGVQHNRFRTLDFDAVEGRLAVIEKRLGVDGPAAYTVPAASDDQPEAGEPAKPGD